MHVRSGLTSFILMAQLILGELLPIVRSFIAWRVAFGVRQAEALLLSVDLTASNERHDAELKIIFPWRHGLVSYALTALAETLRKPAVFQSFIVTQTM